MHSITLVTLLPTHVHSVTKETKDHVLYESFNGIVLAAKEGNDIAECLGNKKAALLQNHGLLTVGSTIEAAVFWFVSMEKCCQAQLMADAAAAGRGGETAKIGDKEAGYTYMTSMTLLLHGITLPVFFSETCLLTVQVGTPVAGWFSAKPLFDVIKKECDGSYLQ